MKKKLLLLLICILFITTGCNNEKNYKVVKCTRNISEEDGMVASMNYNLYYQGKYITKMTSLEKITFDDKNVLKTYKDGYISSYKPYKNLDYYNHTLKQEDNTLISKVEIDYTKLDIDKLIEIEGNDDKFYTKDGKVSLKKIVDFYKKAGIDCDYNK